MLDDEAKRNLQRIREEAFKMWGQDCEFGNIDIVDSPYAEFELPMRLYKRVEVGIYYDRSTMDIGIKQEGDYVILGRFTEEEVFRGFEAMRPEVMRHNFQVLDTVVREMIRKGEV